MGKAAALTALGGGGAAITAGGYYLTKGGGGTAGQGEQKSVTADQQDSQTSPAFIDTLEKFKSESAKDKCIKAIFGDSGIALGSLTEDTANFTDNNSFFGTAPTKDGENQSKSCLTINYEKSKGSGSETDKGTFTWTWIFINKDKAFVNFNVAKTKETKKLNLSGGFYLLSQEGTEDPKAWKIKWKKEVKDTDNKDVESANLATQFPKKKENSQVEINGQDYWDFVGTDGSLTTGTADPKPVHWKWEWKEQKTGENLVGVGEWSGNFKNWWENLYKGSDGGTQFDLEKNIQSFKGTWSKDSA